MPIRFKDNEGKLCVLYDSNGNAGALSIYLTTKLSLANEGMRSSTLQSNRFCHHVIQDNREKIFDATMYSPVFISVVDCKGD